MDRQALDCAPRASWGASLASEPRSEGAQPSGSSPPGRGGLQATMIAATVTLPNALSLRPIAIARPLGRARARPTCVLSRVTQADVCKLHLRTKSVRARAGAIPALPLQPP